MPVWDELCFVAFFLLLGIQHFPRWWGTFRVGLLLKRGFIGLKPYSLDFRKKIIDIYESEPISQRRLAKRFGVRIESLIQEAGATLIYLPPYSPDFSPIENCFSKIKSILRAMEARTYPDLAKAIEKAFSQVSLDDIKGWFTHCCYCTSLDWQML